MADFQTNQQKKRLARDEFIKLCLNIDGKITIEQSKDILKKMGFDASSTKVDKIIRDQDTECINEIAWKGLLSIVDYFLEKNIDEDEDDDSDIPDEVTMLERYEDYVKKMLELATNGICVTPEMSTQLMAQFKILPKED